MKNTLQTNGTLSAHERNLAGINSDIEVMILSGKFKVETGYFEIIESRVKEILPFLLEGMAYTPLELIGEDLWADLTSFGQRQAVLCVKHLAMMPGAPLQEVEFSGSGLSTFQPVATQGMKACMSTTD